MAAPNLPANADELIDLFCGAPPRLKTLEESKKLPRGAETVGFEFEGLAIHGWTLGEGPLALLVHGWASHSAHFSLIGRALGALGYRVLAFDAPSHGASEGEAFTLLDYCRFLGTVARSEGSPKLMVGHSFGSAATALAVSGNKALGGLPRVEAEKLVLLSCFESIADGMRLFLRGQGAPVEHTGPLIRRLSERSGMDPDDYSIPEAAKKLEMPILMVHDRGDEDIPFRCAERISGAAPNARLRPTEGLGHNGLLSDRGVVRAIKEFAAD